MEKEQGSEAAVAALSTIVLRQIDRRVAGHRSASITK